MKTFKPLIYGFLGLLVLSALFCTFSLAYSMLNRLSAQNMQSQWDQLEQENLRAAKKEAQYKNWLNIDKEFSGFKEKYLMKMEDYSKFRNQLTSLFAKNQLQTTGVKHSYKAVFTDIIRVNVNFQLIGTYTNLKHFIFDVISDNKLIMFRKIELSKDKKTGRVEGAFAMEAYLVR
jgi:Tfp pilus assembly protein PilO